LRFVPISSWNRLGLASGMRHKILISSLQFFQIPTLNIINNSTFSNPKTIIILKNNILNFHLKQKILISPSKPTFLLSCSFYIDVTFAFPIIYIAWLLLGVIIIFLFFFLRMSTLLCSLLSLNNEEFVGIQSSLLWRIKFNCFMISNDVLLERMGRGWETVARRAGQCSEPQSRPWADYKRCHETSWRNGKRVNSCFACCCSCWIESCGCWGNLFLFIFCILKPHWIITACYCYCFY